MPLGVKDLYISWSRFDSTGGMLASKKYKVVSGWKSTASYILKLSTEITKIDADIADVDGISGNGTSGIHADLMFQIEKKELKDTEDFSGKFFVKISKNQITDLIESGEPVSLLDQYQVSAKTSSWYWEDDVNPGFKVNNDGSPYDTQGSYGLINYFGYDQNASYNGNHIQSDTNIVNGVGNVNAGGVGALRLTDYAAPWDGILTTFGPTFFVDSMHVASMQSETSDYAKYNCILWAGSTEYQNRTDSNWSYPPLKIWLTDFENSAELLENLDSDSENPTWYNGNLITTSPLVTSGNANWNDLKVDGWVGSLQNVDRRTPTQEVDGGMTNYIGDNQVNGLEGFVTTNSFHATGPRRWFS